MEEEVRMLVLSRKIGEKIYIGEDVFVEVRRVAGNRVTLAISAPKSVRILRGELKEVVDSFEVLSETEVPESDRDTVIMKHNQPAADQVVPKPHTLPVMDSTASSPIK
jgi:carbon storage regulator